MVGFDLILPSHLLNNNYKSHPSSLLADFHDNVSFKNYTNVVVFVMLKTTATKNI